MTPITAYANSKKCVNGIPHVEGEASYDCIAEVSCVTEAWWLVPAHGVIGTLAPAARSASQMFVSRSHD
jgi:hypothetical protein